MAIVGYIRVSTNLQADSIGVQRKAIEDYAKKENIEIRHIIVDENASGGKEYDRRLIVHQAISLLKKGDIFLVHSMDRLARNLGAACLLDKDIKKKKARIVSTMGEGTNMKDDVTALLVTQLMYLFADHERNIIVSRIKLAIANKRSKGERLGHIPFGKRVDKDGILLEDEPKEIVIIKKMIQLRKKKLSHIKIAQYLNEKEYWNRNYAPWTQSSVYRILENNTRDSGK